MGWSPKESAMSRVGEENARASAKEWHEGAQLTAWVEGVRHGVGQATDAQGVQGHRYAVWLLENGEVVYVARPDKKGRDEVLRSFEDLERSLVDCTYVGGYGNPIAPGEECVVAVTDVVRVARPGGLLLERPIEDLAALEIFGPGVQEKGGGFIGGGFGVEGAAEGMIVASVLNSLTTKRAISTVVELQLRDATLIFHYGGRPPEGLRIWFAPVFGMLRERSSTTATPASTVAADLERLAGLVERGFLSREEFDSAKRQLLSPDGR
jgi:hypothetical protein